MSLLAIKEFFVEGGNPSLSHVLLHLTEPSSEEEMKRGYLFGIMEFAHGDERLTKTAASFVDAFEESYYSPTQDSPSSVFEKTVQHLRKKAVELSAASQDSLHCLFGTINDHAIRLTAVGAPHAVVFYRAKDEWRRMPILEGGGGGQDIFGTMLEGEMNDHDVLFVGTQNMTDYFSYDRIEKMIESRGILESAGYIERVLQELGSARSFGGFFIEPIPAKEKPRTGRWKKNPAAAAASLSHLASQTQKTRETLFPPLTHQLSRVFADRKKEREEKKRGRALEAVSARRREKEYQSAQPFLETFLSHLGRSLFGLALGLLRILKQAGLALGKGAIVTIILITNKNNGRAEMIERLRGHLERLTNRLRSLSVIHKILLVAILLLGLLFATSIITVRMREERTREEHNIQEERLAVLDKVSAAEARILYGDTAEALRLLQEARILVRVLNEKTDDRIKEKEILTNQIESHLARLNKMTVVVPSLLVDLHEKDQNSKPQELALLGETLIAFGPEGDSLSLVDVDTGSVTQRSHANIGGLVRATVPKEQNELIFLTNTGSIGRFDPKTQAIEQKQILFPKEPVSIRDILLYNGRLYTLEASEGMILKHARTGTGFDKGTAWLKEAVPGLKDGVALAIDGDIFALEQSGILHAFAQGTPIPVLSTPIDPPLSAPTKLWTSSETSLLYILEPKEKRVVVLQKTGGLVAQYTAKEWIGPSAMVVNEKEKTIFVLDNKKIYRVQIE